MLGESNGNHELTATLTLDDDVDFEVENKEDIDKLTDEIMEEGVIKILS